MPFQNKPTTLAIGIITSAVFVSFFITNPVRAAFITFDIPTDIKEFIVKPIVRKIANSMANKLANRVYEKVSGQTDGHEPFFILSWRNLILESEGRGNDVFRSILKGTEFCDHYKDSLLKTFGADLTEPFTEGKVFDANDKDFLTLLKAPGKEPFDLLNKCTIDFDVDAFRQDFDKGGWNAWFKLIQPQNNFFGAYSNSIGERFNQQELEKDTTRSQAIAGQGFLPNRTDREKARSGGPRGCAIGGPTRCTIFGRTLAPEKLFGDAAARSIDTKLGSYYNAIEFTDVVVALFNSIVNGVMSRLTDFSGFDFAKFAEEEFEADRADGQERRTEACLEACEKAADEYRGCKDPDLTPPEVIQCKVNFVQRCQESCYPSATTPATRTPDTTF